MEVLVQSIVLATVLTVLTTWAWSVVNWVWLRLKRLERLLRQQGLSGKPYTFLFGNLKESSRLLAEAKSKPTATPDDIKPRLLPFVHRSFQTFGIHIFILSLCVALIFPYSLTLACFRPLVDGALMEF
ncbi:hypothetical protein ACJRO7_023341 [Eucalyptus globulus]|uniref:Cytochrome P450 n=1 Tax=Eucalyptus globulus TaxID=34317 RepID=A0ABD3K232_EUCGL